MSRGLSSRWPLLDEREPKPNALAKAESLEEVVERYGRAGDAGAAMDCDTALTAALEPLLLEEKDDGRPPWPVNQCLNESALDEEGGWLGVVEASGSLIQGSRRQVPRSFEAGSQNLSKLPQIPRQINYTPSNTA